MKIALSLRLVMGSAVLTGLCAGAVSKKTDKVHYLNLKVLPKNISSRDLQRIMVDEFNEGLGVGCGFCHAEKQGSHSLDYASDAKAEKNIARNMLRMTLGLNKRYFQVKHPMIGDPDIAVTCTTCHRGTAHPDASMDAAVSP